MDDLVKDLTKIPLSGDDLIEIAKKLGKQKEHMGWITYDSLNQINNISELFQGEINSVFLLIQPPNQNIGHWVTLGMNKNGIFYYDPYGLTIEQDIEITKSSSKLIQLLMGHDVDINKFKHQKFGTDEGAEINTCGRHDSLRAFFFMLSNQEYNDKIIMPLIKNGDVKNGDVIANLLTGFLSDSDKVVKTFITRPSGEPEKDPPELGGPGTPFGRGLFTLLPKVRFDHRSVGGILLR